MQNHPLKETSLGQGLLAFAKSRRVWLVVIMLMLLTCLMAFLDFVSVYLMEVFQLTPSQAAMSSTIFPAGALVGLLASVAFYDRFSAKQIRNVLTLTLVVSTTCVLVLQFMPSFGFSPDINFKVALAAIFLFGLTISPAYYIPMSVFSIEYGGPHSATLVCLIDAFGFAASATFGFVAGRLADGAGGWTSFMSLVIALCVLTTISVWLFMNAEYKVAHSKS